MNWVRRPGNSYQFVIFCSLMPSAKVDSNLKLIRKEVFFDMLQLNLFIDRKFESTLKTDARENFRWKIQLTTMWPRSRKFLRLMI